MSLPTYRLSYYSLSSFNISNVDIVASIEVFNFVSVTSYFVSRNFLVAIAFSALAATIR